MAKVPASCNFPFAKQVARVARTGYAAGTAQRETVHLITSLSRRSASPERLLEINRGHWVIENRLHYVRDVTFHEDRRHHRKNPVIFATLRNLAINLLRLMGVRYVPAARRCFAMQFNLAFA